MTAQRRKPPAFVGSIRSGIRQSTGRFTDWSLRAGLRKPQRPAGTGRLPSPDSAAIDPSAIFAPDRAFIESYSRFDESDEKNFRRTQNAEKVFYREIPFSKYLGDWQFHPARIGGYLTTAKLSPRVLRAAEQLLHYMVELPNGGLALYYPSTVRTARLQANEPIYSGIAQGQLLAAYTRFILEGAVGRRKTDWRQVAARLAESMLFPVERGGVCVDGRIILEAPNYRSCPEAILNGWQDALLRLWDYLKAMPNRRLQDFYRDSLQALIDLLPSFDAPNARLSRYSNLCPYSFRLHLAGRPARRPKIGVFYLSTLQAFRDRHIADLWSEDGLIDCLYDNKIVALSGSAVEVALSVSGQYDLRIEVVAECEAISFDPGTFTVRSSVPEPTHRRHCVGPAVPFDGTKTVFFIQSGQYDLVAGCPTNFMKHGRENFYHSYHVAALYELALTTNEPEQRTALVEWATYWLHYMEDQRHKASSDRFVFSDPAGFTTIINRLRAGGEVKTFEGLQAMAMQAATSE